METDPAPRPTLDRRTLTALAGLLAVVLLVELAEGRWLWVDHFGIVPLALLYALWGHWAGQAAAQRTGWSRRAWLCFAAAGWLELLDVVGHGLLRIVDPQAAAGIALRDATPVASYPLLIAGLVLLAGERSRSSILLRGLDAALVAGSVFFVLWSAVFRDLYAGSPLAWDERLEVMSYPTLGAAVAASAWLVLGSGARNRPAYRLILLAASLPLLTDVVDSVLELRGDATGARIGDFGFFVASAVWVVAARIASRTPPNPVADGGTSRLENYLPLAAMGLALGTAVQTVNEHGRISNLQFWLAVGLISFLLVRMGVTLAENLRLARSLQVLLDERTRLLRFVSHELANPLSPLTLQIGVLRHNDLQPERRDRAFAVMERSVGRLRRLSLDVRALALAETGRLSVTKIPGDLGDLVRHAVEAAAGDAQSKALTVTVDAPPGLTCPMDAERVGQVVDNLLSNAIKYTPHGGHIALQVRANGDHLRVDIRDDGLGLTPEQVRNLFNAFQRFHPGVAPGLGLGLHLSRTLVEAHDGRMGATSPGPNRGSTFWFSLPTSATPGPTTSPDVRP